MRLSPGTEFKSILNQEREGKIAPVSAGQEGNWIQTRPGKGWNVILRLYSPLAAAARPELEAGRFRIGKPRAKVLSANND